MRTIEKSKTVVRVIEAAKTAQGLESDNALAIAIGLDRQNISQFRRGTKPTNEKLLLLCEAARLDFTSTLAQVERDFAENDQQRQKWDNYMKRLGGIAASFVAFAVTSQLYPVISKAFQLAQLST
ncbi:MAG TPA: hypothetical protein VFF03_13475 [Rhodocyclaceae bacterium]|nr:hypothetical protein [Rhodocyclaceae bacterium]